MVLAKEASQILGLYLNGGEPGEIEKETGCSLSTVRAFLNGFDDDVLETLRSFQEISAEFEEPPEVLEALEGARLNRDLEELGLGRNDLEGFIDFCYKVSESPEIVQEAVRLSELEEETGVPYGEVVDRYQELKADVKRLEEAVRGLREKRSEVRGQIEEVEEHLERRKEETGIDLERVERVESVQEELEDRGKRLEDLEQLVDFFDRCEELDFDPKEVGRMVDLKSRMDKFGVDASDISGYLRRNANLDDLGFTLEAASKLAERLDELDSDPVEAAEKLSERFNESELLDRQMADLRSEKNDLRREVEALDEGITSLERQTSSVREEVEALEERREQLLEREVQLKSRLKERQEELEAAEERIAELVEKEERVDEIHELEERAGELREIIEDLEGKREDQPDADLDTLYMKMKEQRDDLFQACVDLFQESSTAIVLLLTEGDSWLDELPPEKVARLGRRIEVLKAQDSYGALSIETLEEAEAKVSERLDGYQERGEAEVEGFEDLTDLTIL